MSNFLEEKKRILVDWLLRNNIDIQNTINAQIGVQDYQEEAMFNATVIASVLLKEKMLDSNFDGLENLLETDAEVIVALRSCEKQHELLNILSSEEFRNIGTSFCVKNILSIYDREKEAVNFMNNKADGGFKNENQQGINTTDTYNNKYSNDYDNNSSFNKANYNQPQYQNNSATFERKGISFNQQPYQSNNSGFEQRGNSFSQPQYQNNNVDFRGRGNSFGQETNSYNSPIGQSNFNNYNQYTNTEDYLHSNNIDDKTIVKEHGLNHIINGVKTITHKLPDGNYSFEMVIPVGYKGDVQSVNKKVITKEEHDRFIENYQNEIFNIEKEYSYHNEMNMELDDDDLVYRPQ